MHIQGHGPELLVFCPGLRTKQRSTIIDETENTEQDANPYLSWELGLNEHTYGLVRQRFTKGTDFRMVTESQVRAVEDRVNHRPGKVLGYPAPAEVFTGALVPL